MSCFFGCKSCGILALWLGMELKPPTLESEVLTTGSPGKPPIHFLDDIFWWAEFLILMNSSVSIFFSYK